MPYKNLVFLLLYYLQILKLFAFLNRKKTIILIYHSITNKSKEDKKRHYLKLHLNSEKFEMEL